MLIKINVFVAEITGSQVDMDEIYRDAQQAHDAIFLAEPSDDIKERFETIRSELCSSDDNDESDPYAYPAVDLNGLCSLSRILLIRMIVQQIVEDAWKTATDQQKTVFYQFGEDSYECVHITKPENSLLSQPANFYLRGIGKYSEEIEPKLTSIANQSSFAAITSKIQESRTSGSPIVPFDDLEQADTDFLNRFVFLQDMEVVRRLFRDRDKTGVLKTKPSNAYDLLPVGFAIAAVSSLMRRKDSTFDFSNTRFFNVFTGDIFCRATAIKNIIGFLGRENLTGDGMKQLLKDEFGQSNPDYP